MFKITKISFVIFFTITHLSKAQESTMTSGGNATASSGSTSYSIGQVVYSTNYGNTGFQIAGVQQPYEISVISGVNQSIFNAKIQVYPNPASEYLQIDFDTDDLDAMSFYLFDYSGKLIETRVIKNNVEYILMENLQPTIYLLKITRNNQEIKAFKILKN